MSTTAQFQTLFKTLGFHNLSTEQETAIINEILKQNSKSGNVNAMPNLNLKDAISQAGKGTFSNGEEQPRYTIGGNVAPGWEPVRKAFESNFQKGLERNSQCCIFHKGNLVVDIYGTNQVATMNTGPPRGYNSDTVQIVFSSTKALASVCMAVCADRGWLNYDDKVSKHWPEFAQNGKENLTIADILRHDGGMHELKETVTYEDMFDQKNRKGRLSTILARQTPFRWSSGPDKGKIPRLYHGLSRGLILNQITIRADPKGRTIGEILHEEVSSKLNAQAYCGRHPFGWEKEVSIGILQGPPKGWRFANLMVPPIVRKHMAAVSTTEKKPLSKTGKSRMEFFNSDASKEHPSLNPSNKSINTMSLDQKKVYEIHGKTWEWEKVKDGFFYTQSPGSMNYDSPSASGRASAKGLAKVMSAMSMACNNTNGSEIISHEGAIRAIGNPVQNAARGNEALVNPFWLGVVGDTAFTNCGLDNHCEKFGFKDRRHVLERLYGKNVYGWGGFGGSSLWFNPHDNIGFAYTVTGGNDGVANGDAERTNPIYLAIRQSVNNLTSAKL